VIRQYPGSDAAPRRRPVAVDQTRPFALIVACRRRAPPLPFP
jgi:hypothetical protein